ncbi:hypothetical protein V6N13_050073 [Hibiscus sabdariffa]
MNTPCWIGGAANHATHTFVLSQLHINGTNQGVHAFIVQIRDADGNICPNIRVADCGHKIGLITVESGNSKPRLLVSFKGYDLNGLPL